MSESNAQSIAREIAALPPANREQWIGRVAAAIEDAEKRGRNEALEEAAEALDEAGWVPSFVGSNLVRALKVNELLNETNSPSDKSLPETKATLPFDEAASSDFEVELERAAQKILGIEMGLKENEYLEEQDPELRSFKQGARKGRELTLAKLPRASLKR